MFRLALVLLGVSLQRCHFQCFAVRPTNGIPDRLLPSAPSPEGPVIEVQVCFRVLSAANDSDAEVPCRGLEVTMGTLRLRTGTLPQRLLGEGVPRKGGESLSIPALAEVLCRGVAPRHGTTAYRLLRSRAALVRDGAQ
jgi:hypothetical protein